MVPVLTTNKLLLVLPQVPHNGFQNGGAKGVTVVVPPGRYVIRRRLEIPQSNVVVKGAGVSSLSLHKIYSARSQRGTHETLEYETWNMRKGAGLSGGGHPVPSRSARACSHAVVAACSLFADVLLAQARELNPCVLQFERPALGIGGLAGPCAEPPLLQPSRSIVRCSPARRRSSFQWGSSSSTVR